ncbi:MAG: carboxypeptidase-like regulatory domain-containing protein [Crocinitomicaceae bacterium]
MTRKKINLLFALLTVVTSMSFSQTKFTLSGQIKDATNGEDLLFADVILNDSTSKNGTNSNEYGFYSITLPEGIYQLTVRSIGFSNFEKEINLNKDISLDIELSLPGDVQELEDIVISAKKEDQNLKKAGTETQLDLETLKVMASLGGEPDIVRLVIADPAVKTAGEGNAGHYVRGGGLDQNLVLLDEAPVYNPSHLLGFFSVFNGDALKSATIYKGGMPAQYGGRTSSVMDITMKDGNSKKLNVSGGIGLIASRISIEAPIVKNKGSFMLSGRRTYADLFLVFANDETLQNTQLYFYDLNLKANYRISKKDRVYLSGYFGRDKLGLGDQFGLNWGNATGTFRWNHLFSDKLFSNTSVIYSDYDFEFGLGQDENEIGLQSVIRDINVKQDFSYFLNKNNKLRFGLNAIYHTVEPGNIRAGANAGISSSDADEKFGLESGIYIQNEQKIGKRLLINYGLRYSLFQALGEGTSYEFDEDGGLVSQTEFGSGEIIQNYGGLEPRLSGNYSLNETSALKFGYNRNLQYMHLLTNSTSSTPTDVWIMSSNNIKPQIADQLSLGYFKNFKSNMYETSVEAYYKNMQNTIDYRTGASTFQNTLIEGDLVYGTGESYGVELSIKKNKGKFTGWLTYSLSKTTRQYDEINNGEKFSARQDRTHDISLIGVYALNNKLSLTGTFVYYTGDAVTFPSGQYTVGGMTVPLYTERNGYRMPDYHRLDLGLTWKTRDTKKFESSWSFSLYNVYGRQNAFSISFQESEENPGVNEAVQLSLFRWIPSFTYNFKFK